MTSCGFGTRRREIDGSAPCLPAGLADSANAIYRSPFVVTRPICFGIHVNSFTASPRRLKTPRNVRHADHSRLDFVLS